MESTNNKKNSRMYYLFWSFLIRLYSINEILDIMNKKEILLNIDYHTKITNYVS